MDDKEFDSSIEYLKSTDLDKVRATIRELGYSGDKKAIPVLMDMLVKEKNIRLKNALALSLGDLGANEAVPLLMELIKDPENKSKRGSFVYALQNLDCKEYFIDFVEMICDGNYEVCSHALDIFESLVDDASFSNKLIAKEKLKAQEQIELAMPPSKHPQYDRIHFIRDALKSLED
jgi:hypothetical protein